MEYQKQAKARECKVWTLDMRPGTEANGQNLGFIHLKALATEAQICISNLGCGTLNEFVRGRPCVSVNTLFLTVDSFQANKLEEVERQTSGCGWRR